MDSLTKTVTVYPKPTTAFAASSNQCFGNNSFTFTNTSNITGGTLTYAWTFGDGGTSTSASPTHSYLASGTCTVKLITTSNNGCMDSLTQSVTVYPKPTTAFAASINQCLANNSFTFTNTSNIAGGTLTYAWTFGDGSTSKAASPTHSYAAAGTYSVKLITTSNNGCMDSLTKTVTVYPKPTTAFAASSNQCLANNSFTFTNNSNIVSGTLTYAWTFGDGGTSTVASPTHSYLAAGTYTIKLITTSNNGCTDSLTKTVTVYPKPTTAFAPSSNQCLANNSFTFTNTSNITGGTLTYNWTFGDGGTSTVASPTYSYAAAGTYTVKLITTSNNGCTDSLTKTVTVYPKPTTAFSASSNQCLANNSFTFTNTSNIVSGTLTYNWSFGDGGTSTAASPTHSYLAAGTYTVKLITTSNNGCMDSLTQSVTVYPKPTTAFAASSNQCLANNSFTFTNTSNITGGTLTYNWTFGDGGTSTAASPTHSYLAAGTYTVKLITTSNNGCTDSLTKTVTVYPKPTTAFAASSNQCLANNSFTFTNTSNIVSGTLTYAWSFGDGGTSTAASPTHSYLAAGTYTVKLITTSNNGCMDSLTKTVTVYPKPTTAFGASSNQCLANNSFTFTNTSNVLGGTLTYNWSFGDGGTSTATSPTHSYAASGTYTVKLITTSNNGCMDSLTKTVTVYPKPTSSFSLNTLPQCYNGNSFTFTNASNISSGSITYTWLFGDGNTSAAINPTYSYSSSGTFSVKLIATSDNGCIDSLRKTVIVYPKVVAGLNLLNNMQCFKNNRFIFTNNSVPAVGGLYQWDLGDGTFSTATSPVHTYAAVGNYTVKLLVTLTSGGCKDSLTQSIFVLSSPIATFNILDSAQCLSSNVFSFVNNTITGSAYLWNFGDGFGSNMTSPTHTYSATGIYPVMLKVFTPNGCNDSITKSVVIKPMPTGAVTISRTVICQGDTAKLVATGGVNYHWYKNGTPISGITDSVFYTTSSGTYTVDITNALGCTSQATNNVQLKVTEKPVANFVFDKYCAGRSTNFTNTSSFGNSLPVSFLWMMPDSSKATSYNATYNFNTAGTYKIKLTVTSTLCSRLADSVEKSINIEAQEKGIRYNSLNAVVSKPLPLKARQIGISYYWSPGTFLDNPMIYNPVFTGTKQQEYNINITKPSGCAVIDTQLVRIHSNFDILVPQAFSPNHDGNNDWFFPFLIGDIELTNFKVINRWGVVVFETNTDRPGWDGNYKGEPQPVDGYVWEAKARDKQGNEIRRKGTVTLVR